MVANLIASRLTVLYGPSGVGKSSFLRAGVARSLRELPEEPLVVVFSRWSEDPSTALAETLADVVGRSSNGSAVAALEEAQSGRDVYLILDQAEEYFLYHADDSGPGPSPRRCPHCSQHHSGSTSSSLCARTRSRSSTASRGESPASSRTRFGSTAWTDAPRGPRSSVPIERFAELTGVAVTAEPALVDRVLNEVGAGQIEPALGGLGSVEGVDERRTYRDALPPARHAAPLGRGASLGIDSVARGDARAARRRAAHRRGAPRGGDGRADGGAEGRRSTPLQPPGHAVGNEDRARGLRPRRLRSRIGRRAPARA